jgi:hypothetical protein
MLLDQALDYPTTYSDASDTALICAAPPGAHAGLNQMKQGNDALGET